MRLLGSLASPYVRKVRIVFEEKRIAHEFVLEDVWSPTTTIARVNPLAKVPCLVLDDGSSVFDSRVIVQVLEDLQPEPNIIPRDPLKRREALVWEALADGLLEAAILVRLEHTQRPADKRHEPWLARQKAKVYAALARAEEQSQSCAPWLLGDSFTLADVALGVALGWLDFRLPEFLAEDQYPRLLAYHQRLEQRPSFELTRPR